MTANLSSPPSRSGERTVEGEVEPQHVDAWIAEDAELSALGVCVDECLDRRR